MRAVRRLLALLLLIGLGTAVSAAEIAIPPSPVHWATDTAGFLQPQTVADLDARLRAYQSATGHQVLVYVAPTTGSGATEDWTVRAFRKWKVGRKGLDDGLILFVFPTDRKVRIEVGYGLEQTVPDATAARIIRDTITPKIRAGQPDAAVTAGVGALLGTIGGEARASGGSGPAGAGATPDAGGKAPGGVEAVPVVTAAPAGSADDVHDSDYWIGLVIGIVIPVLIVIGFIFLIRRLPDNGTYISSGGGGGWGGLLLGGVLGGITGGGLSGFVGGGGMSGGGGATGSW